MITTPTTPTTATATTSAGTRNAAVTRHWPTPLVIDDVDLTGLLDDRRLSDVVADGPPFATMTACSVIADEAGLSAEFLASMNALAVRQGAEPVTKLELEVQVWRAGYDLPATAYAEDFVGWCYLATSPAPEHSESGAIALTDPRAGSAMTAMPGLPWGRQVIVRPIRGAHVAMPGWLTCSVVPVEAHQYAVVALARSAR
jgi:hypothetical protein